MIEALPTTWIHGVPPGTRCDDPPLQVHRHDERTYVLRQSKALTYEAPFLYLFLGDERALLLDTGALADRARMPLRTVVDGLVGEWVARHPHDGYHLLVAHTHGHGDHVAGDAQFADRPQTTVVGRGLDAVQEFFGFTDWPRQVLDLDLGGRVLAVTGCPGHHAASIAVHDPRTGWLLTGDTVYPGRLYVEDPPAFRESLDALVDLAAATSTRAVLGCHIEMTSRPGKDYPLGTTYQPDEPPLAMTPDRLRAVRDAAHAVGDRPGAHVFDDFAIFNGPCTPALLRQVVRRAATTLWQRVRRPTPR